MVFDEEKYVRETEFGCWKMEWMKFRFSVDSVLGIFFEGFKSIVKISRVPDPSCIYFLMK